jgi:hypothetical protein
MQANLMNVNPAHRTYLKHKVGDHRQFKGGEGNTVFMKALGELAAAGMIRRVSPDC